MVLYGKKDIFEWLIRLLFIVSGLGLRMSGGLDDRSDRKDVKIDNRKTSTMKTRLNVDKTFFPVKYVHRLSTSNPLQRCMKITKHVINSGMAIWVYLLASFR